MSELRIITDNKFRKLIYGHELSEKEKKEFDYIENIDSHDFFRYKGHVYDPRDFMRINPSDSFNCNEEFKKWDGYAGDSFFSGIVIKYSENREQVKIGTYLS